MLELLVLLQYDIRCFGDTCLTSSIHVGAYKTPSQCVGLSVKNELMDHFGNLASNEEQTQGLSCN